MRSSKKSLNVEVAHRSPCHLSSPNLAHCSANWLAAPDPSHMAPIFRLRCHFLLAQLCPPLSSHVNPFLLGGSVPVLALADLHSPSPLSLGTHPGPQSVVQGWRIILHALHPSVLRLLVRPSRWTASSIHHCASGKRREKHQLFLRTYYVPDITSGILIYNLSLNPYICLR